MNEGVIYSITCPIHKKIFYVGQSINFKARLKSYFQTGTSGTACDLYIKSLVRQNLKPIFTLHIKCDISELDNQEYGLLNKFVLDGLLLLNRRNNKPENYHAAREFFMGIKLPETKILAEVIDLTIL